MSGLNSVLIKANGALKRGETDLARTICKEALHKYPRNRRLQAAMQSSTAARTGNAAQRQLDAMVAAYQAGRMEEAVRLGGQLLEIIPDNFSVHNL